MNAVLFRSEERFDSFSQTLEKLGVRYTVLNFGSNEWLDFNYSDVDMVIYYPSFQYSSNHPLSLHHVRDDLMHIASMNPHLVMYPDPGLFDFYNDKYKQFLYLKARGYPMPTTYPLLSAESVTIAEERLGYPLVIKNRYGAGGEGVFRVRERKELEKYCKLAVLDLFNPGSIRHFMNMASERIFYYHLIKAKKMKYPFLSPPLLAQEYVTTDRDLKTVVGKGRVVEAHWRHQAHSEQWKVNIDDGGIGVWSRVPQAAIELSERLAADLNARWLNIDIIPRDGEYLITEFSPVWHHYAYREKPSFIYREDYNIETPLEESLDLESLIVRSLIQAVRDKRKNTRSLGR
ncbi:MAG: ATP-grasp domain-containing protein [Nitrospirota bacterium]|jgi:hypothetical protein